MKTGLNIVIRAFVYISLVASICFGIAFSIQSGNLLRGLELGLMCGIPLSTILSLYLLIGLALFHKKIFFYSNIPEQLKAHGVKNVYYESVAGNTTGLRIKYGGLFLTDVSVLFIPHRFAVNPLYIEIPLKSIIEVKKANINLFKAFSGGLRWRLIINTATGEQYEFSVWDLDGWTNKINDSLQSEPTKTS